MHALGVLLAALMAALSFSHTTALVRALLAAGLLTGLFVAWHQRPDWREVVPPFATPLAAWIAWCALSLAWSVDPAYTASELRAEPFYAVATLAVAFYASGREGSERVLLPTLTGTSVALAVAALAWFFTTNETAIPARTFGGPGVLTSTILALFPVASAAALAPGAGQATRSMGLAMAVALLAAGLTALNRTLWPALALQIILVAALLRPPRSDALRLAGLAALALGLAVLQAAIVQNLRFGNEHSHGSPGPGFEDPRPALWSEALDRIASNPVVGLGYGRGILRNDLPVEFGDGKLWHAHNLFLDVGMQLGIPGIVLLALLLAAIAAAGMRLVRCPDAMARSCGAALVAVVAGMVARNLTDDLWTRQSALLFWAVVGTLAGLGARRLRG